MSAVKEPRLKAIKLRFEDFEIDLGARTLKRANQPIPLDSSSFDLLTILLASAPEPVSEAGLAELLWPGTPVEASPLGQHIFLLRRALGGSVHGERIIAAVDQGYRVTAILEGIDIESSDVESSEPEEEARAEEPPLGIVEADDTSRPLRSTYQMQDEPRQDPESQKQKTSREHPREPKTTTYRANEDGEEEARPNLLARITAQIAAIGKSRRLSITLIFAAVLLVAAIVLIFFWPRLRKQSTAPLHVVVAGIQNTTTDPEFDESLRTALTIDLRQSPHLILPSEESVVAALVKRNTAPAESTQTARAIPQTLCRDLKSDAYLTGELRRLGQKYLIILSVRDCAQAKELASARGIADSPQHLITILDRAALVLREQLGESSKALDAFRQPLFPDNTASMPALKAYTDGAALVLDSKSSDAIPLLRRAISIDNHFALAEEELGLLQLKTGDHAEGLTHLAHAHQLRNDANPYDRFNIEAHYNNLVTGDLTAAQRSAHEAVESYPTSSVFLTNLADLEDRTGKSALALDPARQAIALDPANVTAYEILASSQMHMGQLEEAAQSCLLVIQRSIDTAKLHSVLLQIAFQHLDQPAIDEQIAWARNKSEATTILANQAWMELFAGKAESAQHLFTRAIAAFRQQGDDADATLLQAAIPRRFAELGLTTVATAQLARIEHPSEFPDAAIAQAELGNTSRASALIDEAISAHPSSTLLQQMQAPEARAAIALHEHNPQQAIDALQAADTYDRVSFELPLLRGQALLAQHQPEEAETEFHKILDHPGIDPLSQDYPLAQLGLARALTAQGKTSDAIFAYKIVLAIWKDADSDLPRLHEARDEYARLNNPPAADNTPRRRRRR